MGTKESLRKEFLGKRCRLSFEEVFRASSLVQKRFMETREFGGARRIALYSSFRNEVLTDDILSRAVEGGKEVFFPRVVSSGPHLAFFRVTDREELSPGSYDILEPPDGGTEAPPSGFDCVVVPGAAFDMTGARLGYGKGYYDRVLAKVRCPVVGLSFDFQILEEGEMPTEPHDVRVGSVVTESRVIRFRDDIRDDRGPL
ncbi:MAG: 5-formyltetrahydrofolate cyclo-ligase [Thermodesulfobacteriota bacterium]